MALDHYVKANEARIRRLENTTYGEDFRGGLVKDVLQLRTRVGLLMWVGGVTIAGLVGAWTTAIVGGLVG